MNTEPLLATESGRVRVLSLWEPYASLVADGLKPIETRTRPTNIRGLVAIHSTLAAAPPKDYEDVARRLVARGIDPAPYIERKAGGQILALVNLVACRPMTEEDETLALVARTTDDGRARWAWFVENARRVEPVAFSGGQGWRWVPQNRLRVVPQ